MNKNDMIDCKDCLFENGCDMCGVRHKINLQENLNVLCEDGEKIIVSDLTVNYLQVMYSRISIKPVDSVKSINSEIIVLSVHKPSLTTNNKIEDEAIYLMDRFRQLYKTT